MSGPGKSLSTYYEQINIEDRWDEFPPTKADRERLARYERNRLLYRNEHERVFQRANLFTDPQEEDVREAIYSKLNFCRLLSDKTADHLFGEDIVFKSPSDSEAINESMAAISMRSNLPVEEWTGAVEQSYCGETILRVRYDGLREGAEKGCYIETIPAAHYFEELDLENMRDVKGVALAYVVRRENESGLTEDILHRELYRPGRWKRERWKLNGHGQKAALEYQSEWEETHYIGIPVWRIPNQRAGSYWGIDDYESLISLQDSLNNALSRLERVLDKYSDPLLAAPEGVFGDEPAELASQLTSFAELTPEKWRMLNAALDAARYRTRMREMKVMEGDPELLGTLPRYVEWSADLTSRLEQIKQIIDAMMMVSETNPTALGLQTTASVESGWALSIKMSGFHAKIRRRQQNWHKALAEAMFAALSMEHGFMGGPLPELPDIIWPSGLPRNESEDVDKAVKMYSGGVASLETAIRKAQPDLSDEGVQDEIKRIKQELDEARQRNQEDLSAAGLFGDAEGDEGR